MPLLLYPVLFLASTLFLCFSLSESVGCYDEGLVTFAADRILNGDIPHKDFWAIYVPGQFYTIALLFKLFGTSLFVARLYDIFITSGLCLVVFILAKNLSSKRIAFLAWLLALLWVDATSSFNAPDDPALLFGLISLLLFHKYFLKENKRIGLVLSGLFVGIATCFRHDFGFYIFIAQLIPLLFFSNKNKISLIAFYFLSIAIILLPAKIFLIWSVPLKVVFADLIHFPATVLHDYRSIPFPAPIKSPLLLLNKEIPLDLYLYASIRRFVFYIPFIAYVFALIMMFMPKRDNSFKAKNNNLGIKLILLMFGLILYNQVLPRSDFTHLEPTLIVAIILITSLIQHFKNEKKPYKYMLSLGMLLFLFIVPIQENKKRTFTLDFPKHSVKVAQRAHVPKDVNDTINYIQKHVPEDEPIFVGKHSYDHLFTSDIKFYFLAQRKSATKYHDLFPGLATTLEVQKEIARELTEKKVNYIVVIPNKRPNEPNLSAISSGVFYLEKFIKENYEPVERFGRYTVLAKKK